MGGFWDKLNKAAGDFANQFNNAMGNYSGSQSNNNYGFSGGNTDSSQSGGSSGGYHGSFADMVAEKSQNIKFSHFMANIANNSGSVNAMSQTEKNKLLKSALEQCGANNTPNTMLGEIYPIIVKMTDEAERNAALPTAHNSCPEHCPKSRDKCEECLKKRLAILKGLYYLDRPDELKNISSENSLKNKSSQTTKCSLCGAPLKPTMKVCEYCDTAVTNMSEGNDAEFLSAVQFASPEQAVYDLIYEWNMDSLNAANTPENRKVTTAIVVASYAEAGIPKAQTIQMAENGLNRSFDFAAVKMSVSDINYMANEYHISVGAYLRGLFEGDPNLQTAAAYRNKIRVEEDKIRAEEERKQRQGAHEQKMQAMRDSYESRRKTNEEFWQRRRDSYRAPQYSGGGGAGSGLACGGCVNYMPQNGYCAYRNERVNASDTYGSSGCHGYKSK